MSSKAQTWIEFLVVSSTFIIIIVLLLLKFSTITTSDIENIKWQSLCEKSEALEQILDFPGEPINWNSGTLAVFGLGDNLNRGINMSKWTIAKNMPLELLLSKSFPKNSWKVKYKVYAFQEITDSACGQNFGLKICRNASAQQLMISANSSLLANYELVLFFPFSSITLISSSIESDDKVNISEDANGAKLAILFNTNSTDLDFILINYTQQSKLVFIENVIIRSQENLAFKIGNYSAIDYIGPETIPKNFCSLKSKKSLYFDNQVMLADFELIAW
ncbi:MAG: hypothetical protein QXQ79_00830 [Candidatus Nanoarchaeia archaeon]